MEDKGCNPGSGWLVERLILASQCDGMVWVNLSLSSVCSSISPILIEIRGHRVCPRTDLYTL